MARTFIRQDAQVASTNDTLLGFVDNTAPAATMESAAAELATDLNNLRSVANYLRDPAFSGNWYDVLVAPAVLDAGAIRGVQAVGDDLHELERKRFLRRFLSLADVVVGAGDNFVILGGGELPVNTTAAVGAVTTVGTVVAAHGGVFGTHSLSEVAGGTAISPKNFCEIVDGATRDPILSSGRTIYALLQTENAADGHTITTTTPNRVQLSFVRLNAAGDDLEAVPFADIQGLTINYVCRERAAFDDMNEEDLLSDTIVDVPAGSTVTRQAAYDNQGVTPVDLTTNAILDLESPGLEWQLRDDLEAVLFRVVEGSAGGTSEIEVGSDVDLFDVNAVVNDFSAGITVRSGGTRPIDLGVTTDGRLETTAGDLEVGAATELFFDDGNQPGSWAQTQGIKLSEQATDWSTWETNFAGEVSLLEGINTTYALATAGGTRTKVQAVLISNVTAGSDINGPGTPHANTDVDLAPYDLVSFLDDVEVYLNGELMRNDAAGGGTNDVYPGGTVTAGDLKFNFNLKGTGSKPDQLTVIVTGQ